jgi:F-type H+-transporting ATPase subunit a
MALGDEKSFLFFDLIPGYDHYIHDPIFGSILIGSILIGTMAVARSQLKKSLVTDAQGEKILIPDAKLTYRNFFEILAEKLHGLTEGVIGKEHTPAFFPIIGFLFVYILLCNLLGLVPGFYPPTENFNMTLALGTFVFIYYNYVGFKSHGPGYLKHFMGPLIWLAPLMLVIELASHVFRPFSLGLRLRANIMGDHVVLDIFSGLVPYLIPVIFYGIGAFVSFIQAFVFCLLTMVYINLATSHDH